MINWLRDLLLPDGPDSLSVWIRDLAGNYNVATSTLYRANRALGCYSRKNENDNGRWYWYLPDKLGKAIDEVIKKPDKLLESAGMAGDTNLEFIPTG